MTTQLNLARIAVILLFASTFTLMGWLAPMLYATYVPADQIIEVDKFSAEDTTVNSSSHFICFKRDVHQPAPATLFTELYIVDGTDNRIEVASNVMRRYFQGGQQSIVTPFELPDHLSTGTYKYRLVIKMDLADGRVERTFTFISESFVITDGPPKDPTRPASC